MLHCATLLVTCLAIVLMLSRNWELFSNSAFLLAAQQTYCGTSCKRDVTLCNGGKMCCSVAAIVAKSRTWFYFVQWFLQQKCCVTLWLRGMLHLAISLATCVATKLRDKLRHKLHSVIAPLRTNAKILHSLQNNNSNLLLFVEALHIKFKKPELNSGLQASNELIVFRSVIQLSVNTTPHISLFLYSWLCLFPFPPNKDLSTLVNSLVWQRPWNRIEISPL